MFPLDESDKNWDGILRGGPFLEISFLLDTRGESSVQFLERALVTLESTKITAKLVNTGQNSIIFQQFKEGYPFDPEDPDSIILHKAEFGVKMHFPDERKARLCVEEVAPNTLQFDFAFFGSQFDAPEWKQRGVSHGDEPKFVSLFEELHRVFNFPLGVIGFEIDCLFLFPEYEPSPSETYQISRFDPTMIPDNPALEVILWNGQYLKYAFSLNLT